MSRRFLLGQASVSFASAKMLEEIALDKCKVISNTATKIAHVGVEEHLSARERSRKQLGKIKKVLKLAHGRKAA